MATLAEMVDVMKAKLDEMKTDVEKFYEKGNKSAGVRIRKVLQEIKKDAQDVRIFVNDIIKKSKEKN